MPEEQQTSPERDQAPAPGASLADLARLFLRLGATSFGGPAAHIALMEHEVVRRLRWLTRDEFLDMLGATNLIPGPNSTEMAIHVGWRQRGWAGLVVAGVCFIAPAAVMVVAIAWAYVRYGARPEAAALLYGIKPVMIAVVVQALWRLGRQALKRGELALIALTGVGCIAAGGNEILVLLGAGWMALAARSIRERARGPGSPMARAVVPAWTLLAGLIGLSAGEPAPFSLLRLFLFFLKVGSILFGSGYVLLEFIRADLVERWGWLGESQLLDAIAVGQVTPGPVFTTATFIGFILGGFSGAVIATIAIFLPAFVFVALSGPIVPRIRRSPAAGAFLDGVNAASLALMAVVTWYLGRAAIVDPVTAVLAVASGIALFRLGLNSAWLVLAGGVAGLFRMVI
jgi:chromate transporter